MPWTTDPSISVFSFIDLSTNVHSTIIPTTISPTTVPSTIIYPYTIQCLISNLLMVKI